MNKVNLELSGVFVGLGDQTSEVKISVPKTEIKGGKYLRIAEYLSHVKSKPGVYSFHGKGILPTTVFFNSRTSSFVLFDKTRSLKLEVDRFSVVNYVIISRWRFWRKVLKSAEYLLYVLVLIFIGLWIFIYQIW